MKICSLLLLLCALPVLGHAESRSIGIRIDLDAKNDPRISIYSDGKKEDRRDLTMEKAEKILREAKGSGSSIFVGIIAHNVPVSKYLNLLKVISENAWLKLVFVEGKEPSLIGDNIKRRMEGD